MRGLPRVLAVTPGNGNSSMADFQQPPETYAAVKQCGHSHTYIVVLHHILIQQQLQAHPLVPSSLRDNALAALIKNRPPSMEAVLSNAIARCPFLHKVAEQQGDVFAKAIALDPTRPADQARKRPVLEDFEDYQSTFRLWHGSDGVVPLVKLASAQGASPARPAYGSAQPHAAPAVVLAPSNTSVARPSGCPTAKGRSPLAGAPLATMSMSFGAGLPDFGKLFKALQQHHQLSNRRSQPSQRPKPSNRGGAMDGQGQGPNLKPKPVSGNTSQPASSGGGQCPMRKVLGPLAPLVFNSKGHLQCPEAIVRARAALAATKPVRDLRPQALPVKLLAVGATAASVNVPCGMVREHTEKFSFGWFVAVHASIPFIAMLRKAVIMPKYAILYTIASAIAGQAMGAKLERQRLAANSQLMTSSARYPLTTPAPVTKPLLLAQAAAFQISSSPRHGVHISSKGRRPAGSRPGVPGITADCTSLLVTPQLQHDFQDVSMLAGTSPNALVAVKC